MSVRPNGIAWLAGAAAVVALAAGCTSESNNTPPGGTSPSLVPSSGLPTSTVPSSGNVSEAAAKDLCTRIEGTLSDWRVQGPTLGRPGLNILVQEWAARNGGLNIEIIKDRTIVDQVTSATCADVRQQALSALDLPDLASGLVGF